MSEVYARRIYRFKPRFGHQLHMGAAEIRTAILNLGQDVLGSEFSVEILSEKENTILVQCSAATGELVYEIDTKILYKVLNFCEKNDLDFAVDDVEVKTPDMDEWV